MFFLHSLLVTLGALNLASAMMHVALPLYLWPSAGAWSPFYNVISSNPNTTFDVIVNPNSGPGSYPPDPAYVTAVAKLNSYKNVNVYGYIPTSYAGRELSAIKSDVQTYAKWNTYSGANLTLYGIFFDEATSDTAELSYMASVQSLVHSNMANKSNSVWTNPGWAVDAKFYQYADIVTAFESTWQEWITVGKFTSFLPASLRSKSSIMINDYKGGNPFIPQQATNMRNFGYHSALLSTWSSTNGYQCWDKTWGSWSNYVAPH